jgi:hypothetical protein
MSLSRQAVSRQTVLIDDDLQLSHLAAGHLDASNARD